MISSKSRPSRQGHLAKRGDVWLASFDPTIGHEIQKTRPAIVINPKAAKPAKTAAASALSQREKPSKSKG